MSAWPHRRSPIALRLTPPVSPSTSSRRKPSTRRSGASSTRSPPPSGRCRPTPTPSPSSARCACRATPARRSSAAGESSVEWATFVNGLLIRYLDFNDTYLCKEPAHPSDNLAAVLAVGEAVGAGGRDLITAAVLAYEIQCRFCDAASLRKHGVDHVTYGAISSAVAAGEADEARRDEDARTRSASPACATSRCGRRGRGELSMWKGCAFANAARNGVFAATLAADGHDRPGADLRGRPRLLQAGHARAVRPRPVRRRARQRRRVHDQQDLHQVLAGRVPLAERHRRGPAAARGTQRRRVAGRRRSTSTRSRRVTTSSASTRRRGRRRPARRPTTACRTAPPRRCTTAT